MPDAERVEEIRHHVETFRIHSRDVLGREELHGEVLMLADLLTALDECERMKNKVADIGAKAIAERDSLRRVRDAGKNYREAELDFNRRRSDIDDADFDDLYNHLVLAEEEFDAELTRHNTEHPEG